jgi:hypothetical protein
VTPIGDITPLHLNREWSRLLKCGGPYSRDQNLPQSTAPDERKDGAQHGGSRFLGVQQSD